MECVETQFEHQVNLPQEQRERISSLEVDCDQVSPVRPCEVDRVYSANECTQSLGGMETQGFLVVTQIPNVIVPECVSRCASGVSDMACVEMVHGPIQTGDLNGELKGRKGLI